MKVRQMVIVASALLTAFATSAHAKDLHVPSKQFRTIKRAVRKARTGDTIFVHPGVYEEPNVVLKRRGVTLIGDDAVWRSKGSKRRYLTLRGDDCEVGGFTFDGISIRAKGDRVVLRDSKLTGATRSFPLLVTGDDVEILDNDFSVLTGQRDFRATVTIEGTAALVRGNSIRVQPPEHDSARYCLECSRDGVVIDGNTLTGGVGEKDRMLWIEGAQPRIVRNVMRADGGGGIDGQMRNAVVESNLIELGGSGVAVWLTGDGSRITDNTLSRTGASEADLVSCRGAGIDVARNTASAPGGRLVVVEGHDASIRLNALHGVANGTAHGAWVFGDDALVSENTIDGLGSRGVGIYIQGDRSQVLDNTTSGDPLTGPSHDGIAVHGDDGTARNNTSSWTRTGVLVAGDRNVVQSHSATENGLHGIYVVGNDNVVEDCEAFNSRHDGFNLQGDRNTLRRCTSVGSRASGSAGLSSGIGIDGNSNLVSDVAASGMRNHGAYVRGGLNVLERCTLAATWSGVFVSGGQNEFTDFTITASGRAGFEVSQGPQNSFLRCVSRGGDPGYLIERFAIDTTLNVCESENARSEGLRHDGIRSVIAACTFLGSGYVDVVNTGAFSLVNGNTFVTGGF